MSEPESTTPEQPARKPKRFSVDNYAYPSAPRLGVRGWLRWGWRQVTSMRLALVLLLLLGLAAIPGSLLPQWPTNGAKTQSFIDNNPGIGPLLDKVGLLDVFGSAWFTSIYVLLFLSLIGCIIPRAVAHGKAALVPVASAPSSLARYDGRLEASSPLSQSRCRGRVAHVGQGARACGAGSPATACASTSASRATARPRWPWRSSRGACASGETWSSTRRSWACCARSRLARRTRIAARRSSSRARPSPTRPSTTTASRRAGSSTPRGSSPSPSSSTGSIPSSTSPAAPCRSRRTSPTRTRARRPRTRPSRSTTRSGSTAATSTSRATATRRCSP